MASAKILLSATAVCLGAWSAPAWAGEKDDTVVLEPSTTWNIDYGETDCRLARAFGPEDNRHLLFMEQFGPSRTFAMTLAGPELDRFRTGSRVVTQFGSLPEYDEWSPFLGTTENFGRSVIYSSVDFLSRDEEPEDGGKLLTIDLESAAKSEAITLRQGKKTVVVNTGNLEAPMKALNQCALDLIRHWGLDPAKHESMTQRPVWTNQGVIARRIASVYPSSALRKGEQGIFEMRVIVEGNGDVSDCHVEKATMSESLRTNACEEMTRARFEPALDKDGVPMRSFYTTKITYIMN